MKQKHVMEQDSLALFGGQPIASHLTYPSWPPVDDQTAQALLDVYRSGSWSFQGPQERAFASQFAAYHDAAYGVFVMNGTVALQCALHACGIQAGDEVIVPAVTWIATATAPAHMGAIPVFVDIEPTTLCIDPQHIEAAITEKTRAILPVHLHGAAADLDAIGALARRYGLKVIEDCAHAHGGKWNGRGLGSWGDVGAFSFQQSKVMSSGEGGICLTNDAGIAQRLYRCKQIGYLPTDLPHQFTSRPPHDLPCHNFRATEFQAVILLSQLEQLQQRIARYNTNAASLKQALEAVPGVRAQAGGRLSAPQNYYGLVLLFDEEPLARVALETIVQALVAEGLTQGIYPMDIPVYRHPFFNVDRSQYRVAEGGCPVAEQLASRHALILNHQWLSTDEQVMETLARVLRKLSQQAHHLLAQEEREEIRNV